MSAENELRYFEDVWVQMLLLLVVVSGAFTAVDYGPLLRRLGSAGADAGRGTGGHAGIIVVDPKRGAGSDCPTLAQAVSRAQDGDTIVLRPGTYNESVTLSKSLTITGSGTQASEVILSTGMPRTVLVTAGRVSLKLVSVNNVSSEEEAAAVEVSGGSLSLEQFGVLSARHGVIVEAGARLEATDGKIDAGYSVSLSGGPPLPPPAVRALAVRGGEAKLLRVALSDNAAAKGTVAVEVSKGDLSLERSPVSAMLGGVLIEDGRLDVSESKLAASRALTVEGASNASLTRAEILGGPSGVSIEGMGELRIENSVVRAAAGPGIDASQFAKVRLTETEVSQCPAAAVAARSGADISAVRSRLTANGGCGVSVDGASASLDHVLFDRDRCGVGFLGPGSLDSEQSEYRSTLALGALAIRPGHESEVVVKGDGNIGLRIPAGTRRR